MDRGVAVLLTVVVGCLVGVQAPINGVLGRTVGSVQAAFVAFVIGTALLTVIVAAAGGFGGIGEARTLEWYYVVGGGLIGVAYVTTVLVTVRSLGAGGVTAATIASQLAISVVVDHFGLLGLPRSPLTLGKVAGVALLALGTFLVVRE